MPQQMVHASENIPAGAPLRVTGSQNQEPVVAIADTTTDDVDGVAMKAILSGGRGYMVRGGAIAKVHVGSTVVADGDPLTDGGDGYFGNEGDIIFGHILGVKDADNIARAWLEDSASSGGGGDEGGGGAQLIYHQHWDVNLSDEGFWPVADSAFFGWAEETVIDDPGWSQTIGEGATIGLDGSAREAIFTPTVAGLTVVSFMAVFNSGKTPRLDIVTPPEQSVIDLSPADGTEGWPNLTINWVGAADVSQQWGFKGRNGSGADRQIVYLDINVAFIPFA